MASLTQQLTAIFGDAFASLGLDRAHGSVVVSQRPELAQFQCNGALAASRTAQRNPRQLADDVIDALPSTEIFAELSVAGPGFINIVLNDEHLAVAATAMEGHERMGVDPPAEPSLVLVDYGGPNVAKSLHVGHLRPAIIGESVKRLFAFAGYPTLGDIHVGDWGMPMAQVIALIEERHPNLPFFATDGGEPYPADVPFTEADLEELYPEAVGRAKEDEEFAAKARAVNASLQGGEPGPLALLDRIRDVSLADMKRTYDDLNVHFELWYGEARVHDRIPAMIRRMQEADVVLESEGALVVEVALPSDKTEIPPLLLARSDGTYMYSTTDLATIEERVDDLGASVILYVVDARQSMHFEQVFRAARASGIAPEDVILEHDPFGTVNGADGKPMKTRTGDLPPLRGLIEDAWERAEQRLDESDLATEYPDEERRRIARQVGTAAIKYGDLQNHRTSDYVFDLDRFVSFAGKTGPYLLYSAVRIGSILRNAADQNLSPGPILPPVVAAERNLVLQLLRFPDVIERALEYRAPNHVAEYAYDLSTDFNRFYEACHILSEPDAERQASWLGLVALVRRVLDTLLELLAIEVPERM